MLKAESLVNDDEELNFRLTNPGRQMDTQISSERLPNINVTSTYRCIELLTNSKNKDLNKRIVFELKETQVRPKSRSLKSIPESKE
jgi:hypothetical protein